MKELTDFGTIDVDVAQHIIEHLARWLAGAWMRLEELGHPHDITRLAADIASGRYYENLGG